MQLSWMTSTADSFLDFGALDFSFVSSFLLEFVSCYFFLLKEESDRVKIESLIWLKTLDGPESDMFVFW